jgi:hypothetical protein
MMTGTGVGIQPTNSTINNSLTSPALQMRNLMQAVANLNSQVNGNGEGLAYLESIGYSSVPNPANPNSISDAQYAQTCIAYLNQPAGVYMGTVQSGGSGGTGAIQFNIDAALAFLWNVQ